MKKTYSNEEFNPPEENSPKVIKTTNQRHDTEGSGSCFSSEVEIQKQKKPEKRPGNIEKFTYAFSQSFFPPIIPQSSTIENEKWRELRMRTIWTLSMLLCFCFILALGHFYCALLVLSIIFCIFYELMDVPRYKERSLEVKHYSLFSWFFFALCIYHFYIKMSLDKMLYLQKYTFIHYLCRYHSFICFMLYIGAFLIFIKSLTKGYYKYQFRQFAYLHLILLIFGFSSSLIVSNIFNGLVWFLIPVSLVILNDISSFLWGKFFGKHTLTPISPKKTWEGSIGGLFTTLIWCYFFTEILIRYDWIMCPVREIDAVPFSIFKLTCDVSYYRAPYEINLDLYYFGRITWNVKTLHFHTFFLCFFESLLAPLGGLFASGFKRTIKMKDYSEAISGVGLSERMDCQILMGFFTYIWVSQFVFYDERKVMLNLIKKIDHMHYDEKYYLYNYLKESLGLLT